MNGELFSTLALDNVPSGITVISLGGKVQVLNRSAKRILGIEQLNLKGSYDEVFASQPKITAILKNALETGIAVNRQEVRIKTAQGETLLGYGTMVLRDENNAPVGMGMIFQDITRFIPLPLTMQFMGLLNKFFTPFAIVLVLSALAFGYAEHWQKIASALILLFTTIMNMSTLVVAKKAPNLSKTIGRLRVLINFSANTLLVYFLGTLWGPMWLLFLLTPLATGLYASMKATLATSFISAGTLLGIYYMRGLSGEVGWGQAGIHAIFIVFTSLFVNRLTELISSIRSKQS